MTDDYAPPAPQTGSQSITASAALEQWFNDHIRNSAIATDTERANRVMASCRILMSDLGGM